MNGIFAFILGLLSLLTGWLVRIELPKPFSTWSCKVFAVFFGIDLSLAEKPVEEYKNIEELFTRRLKSGLRPVGAGLVSPADGLWTQSAYASDEEMAIQVKGKFYSLAELTQSLHLGDSFTAKWYGVFYLSPKDYHRVHVSTDSTLLSIQYVPGALWPVNSLAVRYVPELFVSNERLIFQLQDKASGEIYFIVMVGALNVGRMRTPFWPDFETNTSVLKDTVDLIPDDSIQLKAGDELGTFSLGSTVVLVSGQRFLDFHKPKLFENGTVPIHMGDELR